MPKKDDVAIVPRLASIEAVTEAWEWNHMLVQIEQLGVRVRQSRSTATTPKTSPKNRIEAILWQLYGRFFTLPRAGSFHSDHA